MHLAALNGQVECVRELVELGADLDILNKKRQTPLLLAVAQFNFEIIQLLVENGKTFFVLLSFLFFT